MRQARLESWVLSAGAPAAAARGAARAAMFTRGSPVPPRRRRPRGLVRSIELAVLPAESDSRCCRWQIWSVRNHPPLVPVVYQGQVNHLRQLAGADLLQRVRACCSSRQQCEAVVAMGNGETDSELTMVVDV